MIALEQARQYLESLGLKQAVEVLDNTLDTAASKQLTYPEMLEQLLGVEVDARRERYLSTRTKMAHFPFQRTLEQFDFAFQPSIDEWQVKELANLAFVAEVSRAAMKCPACRWCADGSRSQLMILEWNSSATHLPGAMRSRASISSLSSAMAWPRLVRVSRRFAEWIAEREASRSLAREVSSRAIAGSARLSRLAVRVGFGILDGHVGPPGYCSLCCLLREASG